jgi:hypothetical protein
MSTSDRTRPIDLPLSERIPYPGVYQHIYLTRHKRPAHYRVRFIIPKRLYREGALPTPEGVEAYYGKNLRTVYLGCHKDPDVAFTALLMFLLNFVVEFPWTAPDVLCYLRSLDYSTPRIPFLDGITTVQDMRLFAHMEVFEMFPVAEDDDESLFRDLEEAVSHSSSSRPSKAAAGIDAATEEAAEDDPLLSFNVDLVLATCRWAP